MSKEKQKHTHFGELLMINYYSPPVHVAGAIRLFHFQGEAKKYFKRISVLTSANVRLMRQDPSLETKPSNTYFIPTFDLRRIQLLRQSGSSPHLSTGLKSNKLVRFLQKLADSFPFSLLLADGGLWYIWKAYQQGKKLVREGQITHIFSSFRPMADHWVAFLLKRRFPQLYWIADFRDLPVDPVRQNVIFPSLQKRIQARIIDRANLSTTVSKGLAKHLSSRVKSSFVLPNALPSTTSSMEDVPLATHFTIAYTGSIYPSFQSFDLFFSAILKARYLAKDQLSELRLVYAGKDGSYWDFLVLKYGLENIAQNRGLVSITEAEAIQKRSHINLLMTWSKSGLSGVFTAKFYSYLAAERPILAIVNGERDEEMASLFEALDCGEIYASSQEKRYDSLANDLLAWYEDWHFRNKPLKAIDREGLREMRWDRQFLQLMKKVEGRIGC